MKKKKNVNKKLGSKFISKMDSLMTDMEIDLDNLRMDVTKFEDKCIRSGIGKYHANNSYIEEVIDELSEKGIITEEVIEAIVNGVKYHMLSKTSVLRYSPLRLSYTLLSIYYVCRDEHMLTDKRLLGKLKRINDTNCDFTLHNREVIRSITVLEERSTYWKTIKDFCCPKTKSK